MEEATPVVGRGSKYNVFLYIFVCAVCFVFTLLFLLMSFKFGAWNVRGLNDPYKQKSVRDFIKRENLRFFGFLETKVKVENFENTFGKVLGIGIELATISGPLWEESVYVGIRYFVRLK